MLHRYAELTGELRIAGQPAAYRQPECDVDGNTGDIEVVPATIDRWEAICALFGFAEIRTGARMPELRRMLSER